jgi:predicted Fe-Mo cluster-binding NifX family protein
MLNLCGDRVADVASDSSAAGARTAVLVMNSGSTALLCPFFSKCDGVLLIDAADGSKKFHPRDRSGVKSMCDCILELKPGRIICGFIVEPEMQKLRAAGIDVRLGSCNCSVDDLVSTFSTLPKA